MSKLKRFERRIRKYRFKLSEIKFKEKIKEKLTKIVDRIGISKPDEFKLIDTPPKEMVFPCHLGISTYGKFRKKLIRTVISQVESIFEGFFYNVVDLGNFNFTKEIVRKGVRKEVKKFKDSSIKIGLHPTNKFYQILINKRIENHLDMINAIINVPIYSSEKNNIIFLFGEANLKHRCCVVSSLLLKEGFYKRVHNNELFTKRMSKEIVHEIGHLILGAEHCLNENCVMRFSMTLNDVDMKKMSLCKKCESKLVKMRKGYNF